MFRLVVVIHLSDIDSLFWEKLQGHALCRILRMSVNGVWTISSFASWVIHVPIGCRPHLSDIGCVYWEQLQRHARCCILRMSLNGASTIFSLQSWVIYFPIGCGHPFIKYWQPLMPKTTATCSLPHSENERQWRVNSVSCCIFGNRGITLISAFIMGLLPATIGKNTMFQR